MPAQRRVEAQLHDRVGQRDGDAQGAADDGERQAAAPAQGYGEREPLRRFRAEPQEQRDRAPARPSQYRGVVAERLAYGSCRSAREDSGKSSRTRPLAA